MILEKTEIRPQTEGIKSEVLQKISQTGLVEVQTALRLVGGSEDTYLLILKTFLSNVERKIRILQGFFERQAWNDFRIEVHSQKSALSNIGAKKLSEDARKLELAVSSPNISYVRENTFHYLREMMSLCDRLAEFLPVATKTTARPAASAASRAELIPILEQIRDMIDGLENETALALVDQLLQWSYDDKTDQTLLEIRNTVNQFDYDAATLAIDELSTRV